MRRSMLCLVSLLALLGARAPQPAQELRFTHLDVYVTPANGEALTAWQVELSDDSGRAQLVGVEGGVTNPASLGDALKGAAGDERLPAQERVARRALPVSRLAHEHDRESRRRHDSERRAQVSLARPGREHQKPVEVNFLLCSVLLNHLRRIPFRANLAGRHVETRETV